MTEIKKRLESYPEVSFVEDISFTDLQAQMIRDYQNRYKELTSRDTVLAAADPIRMILYSCAVAIYQGYQYEDRAGKMGLLKYSTGEFLDNLAAFKKTERGQPTAALTTLRFTLAAILSQPAMIGKGTRVKAGNLYFETTESGVIPAGELETDLPARCLTSGLSGNGFMEGEIKTLVDPLGYNLSVSNITQTAGGADRETDEELRERIYLAPSSYSTAGPEAAYRYWVMSYSQAIENCLVTSSQPGQVDIYLTMKGGELPDETMLAALELYLKNSSIRPLTDYVKVHAPDLISYDVEAVYYIGQSRRDMAETIQKEVKLACDNYIDWQKAAIGRDVNPSQLIYCLMAAGAKYVDVTSPVFTKVPASAIAQAGNVTLVCGGIQDD